MQIIHRAVATFLIDQTGIKRGQAATHSIAQGLRAGQKVLSPQLALWYLGRSGESLALCAHTHTHTHGFSLCAGVSIAVRERLGLDHLCRYITSRHVMAPMELMQHWVALVPLPLTRPRTMQPI